MMGWFWEQGYADAIEGRNAIPPDHTRGPIDRGDYFDGYEAGCEDRYPPEPKDNQ